MYTGVAVGEASPLGSVQNILYYYYYTGSY